MIKRILTTLLISIFLIPYRPVFTPNGRCLYDFETFAYGDVWKTNPNQRISPLIPWENRQSTRGASWITFSRIINGQQELWFRSNPSWPPIIAKVFNRDIKAWRDLNLSDPQRSQFDSVVNFAVDSHGQVWGLASKRIQGGSRAKAVLVQYREEQADFITIATTEDVDFTQADEATLSEYSNILVTKSGEIILFIGSITNKVYVYNPDLETLEKLPDYQGFAYPEIAISNDGEIYLSTIVFDNMLPYQNPAQPAFVRYDANSKTWVDLELPNGFQPREGNIGFNSEGRLHIGTSAWRDVDETWHITYPYSIHRADVYPRVELKFISSDGRLWFTREQIILSGTGWYDPATGEGCMFTNMVPLSIIEDHQQYLWMAVDGSIYRLNLNDV